MKKIFLSFMIVFSLFIITGCQTNKKNNDEKVPFNLKKITGKVRKASLNDDGYIVINKSEVTQKVSYYNYIYEDVQIGLLTVKDSSGNVRIVINTCQSCGGAPYAYFVQVGNKIQCQNCGNMFSIDDLGNLEEDGCNPITIEDLTDEGDIIKIGVKQLEDLKDKFKDWKGPKVK